MLPVGMAQHGMPSPASSPMPMGVQVGVPSLSSAGFTGILPQGGMPPTQVQQAALLLNPLMVKDAVYNLRQAHAAAFPQAAGGASSSAAKSAAKGAVKSSVPSAPDYYGVLGLKKNDDETAVKKSYRKLVLLWHPDKHPENREEADEKIRLINSAYETLSNIVKRQGYDQMLEAIERKRKGERLDVSQIQPRMSIPKEFMLCPLGHPDKFVRALGSDLLVQSREDVRTGFNDFFSAARFSLWWLPEVNNMCRLRTTESAAQGKEGGLMLNFLMDGTPTVGGEICVKDADCVLKRSEDPRYTNVIAVASPYSPGAFRFEGAFWPGHYLSYRAPTGLCMVGLSDELRDVTDFYLVDYGAAYKTMTIGEALLGPVQKQGGGDYVSFSDLRADLSVRAFFQNTLGCPAWNNREFEIFFEGHYEQWEFDRKRARVRPRPAVQQLVERLQAVSKTSDLASAVLGAGQEIGKLPPELVEQTLTRLSQAPEAVAVSHSAAGQDEGSCGNTGASGDTTALTIATPDENSKARAANAVAGASASSGLAGVFGAAGAPARLARQRLVASLSSVCAAVKDGVPLPMLLSLHRAAQAALAADEAAGADAEQLEPARVSARHPGSLIGDRLRRFPNELERGNLFEVLAAPLTWEDAAGTVEPALKALEPILAMPTELGMFLPPLEAAARLRSRTGTQTASKNDLQENHAWESGGPPVQVLEALAKRELQAMDVAVGALQVAAPTKGIPDAALALLTALGEGRLLPGEVSARLKQPLLGKLPFPMFVRLLASLGEQGQSDDNIREAVRSRIHLTAGSQELASVQKDDLLRLVRASSSSPALAQLALGYSASAAAAALSWDAEEVARIVQLVAELSNDDEECSGAAVEPTAPVAADSKPKPKDEPKEEPEESAPKHDDVDKSPPKETPQEGKSDEATAPGTATPNAAGEAANTGTASVSTFLSQAAEALPRKLKDLSTEILLDLTLAIATLKQSSALSLLGACAREMVDRGSNQSADGDTVNTGDEARLRNLSSSQLVQLTEGVVSLGISSTSVLRLLDFWARQLAPSDDCATDDKKDSEPSAPSTAPPKPAGDSESAPLQTGADVGEATAAPDADGGGDKPSDDASNKMLPIPLQADDAARLMVAFTGLVAPASSTQDVSTGTPPKSLVTTLEALGTHLEKAAWSLRSSSRRALEAVFPAGAALETEPVFPSKERLLAALRPPRREKRPAPRGERDPAASSGVFAATWRNLGGQGGGRDRWQSDRWQYKDARDKWGRSGDWRGDSDDRGDRDRRGGARDAEWRNGDRRGGAADVRDGGRRGGADVRNADRRGGDLDRRGGGGADNSGRRGDAGGRGAASRNDDRRGGADVRDRPVRRHSCSRSVRRDREPAIRLTRNTDSRDGMRAGGDNQGRSGHGRDRSRSRDAGGEGGRGGRNPEHRDREREQRDREQCCSDRGERDRGRDHDRGRGR